MGFAEAEGRSGSKERARNGRRFFFWGGGERNGATTRKGKKGEAELGRDYRDTHRKSTYAHFAFFLDHTTALHHIEGSIWTVVLVLRNAFRPPMLR